jgi:thioredoxin reductase
VKSGVKPFWPFAVHTKQCFGWGRRIDGDDRWCLRQPFPRDRRFHNARTGVQAVNSKTYDYIVLGAGPAGIQLGHFLEVAGRDYLILEGGKGPGTFFRTYPRHRQLISINKRYTGQNDPEVAMRMDWNSLLSSHEGLLFTHWSERYFPQADEFVRYLEEFAKTCQLNTQYDTRIVRVSRHGTFELRDQHDRIYRCRRLIVATGVSREYIPEIPGIELVDSYSTVSVDPRDFVNQRVLIIGKGNSAFETADNLVGTTAAVHVAGPSAIKFAWQTHYVGHLRAINNNLLDTYQLKSQNAILDGNIARIEKRGDKFVVTFSFVRANEVQKELVYDRVIACTGFRFDATIFDTGCRPELAIKNRFPAQTAGWESVNVPDLFFAGTLTQQRDFKKSTSGFIHGFRYCARSLSRMLARRYHADSWPGDFMVPTAEALMERVIERVNRSSALWQQFGFLGDAIVFDDQGALYLEELPVEYVHHRDMAPPGLYFIVTLEYGPDHAAVDPFDIDVMRVSQDEAERPFDSQYLHPIVRCFSNSELIAEHHVPENLENEWNRPQHKHALAGWFRQQLAVEVTVVPRPARIEPVDRM